MTEALTSHPDLTLNDTPAAGLPPAAPGVEAAVHAIADRSRAASREMARANRAWTTSIARDVLMKAEVWLIFTRSERQVCTCLPLA